MVGKHHQKYFAKSGMVARIMKNHGTFPWWKWRMVAQKYWLAMELYQECKRGWLHRRKSQWKYSLTAMEVGDAYCDIKFALWDEGKIIWLHRLWTEIIIFHVGKGGWRHGLWSAREIFPGGKGGCRCGLWHIVENVSTISYDCCGINPKKEKIICHDGTIGPGEVSQE